MNRIFHLAAAEKGLGFFALDLKTHAIAWEEETARILGAEADAARKTLLRYLATDLRSYVLREIAEGSREQLRCLIPLAGQVMEVVIASPSKGAGDRREGFWAPLSLNEPLNMMKKYFLSNISNKLRSLLNSVIIASDVVAASDHDAILKHQKFLSLLAEDAREVNTLLNRLGETINYDIPATPAVAKLIEVPPLLASLHANLHYLAEDTSIALTLAVPETVPPFKGELTRSLLVFFLAVHYALSHTDPLGEILITARERQGWEVELCFANGDLPPDLAIFPEKHGLIPVFPAGWSESAQLQLIDSLLGLGDTGITLLGNGRGLGLLRMPLPRN